MECYSMSLSTAQMEERDNIELWQRYGVTGSLVYCQGEHKMIHSHWKHIACVFTFLPCYQDMIQ